VALAKHSFKLPGSQRSATPHEEMVLAQGLGNEAGEAAINIQQNSRSYAPLDHPLPAFAGTGFADDDGRMVSLRFKMLA
jgi:hypothetical protein